MKILTADEERALRYYEGDVSKEDPDDPFWSDAKAYVTLNAILFDGIDTELARSDENRYLNPAFFDDDRRLISVIGNLLSALKKSSREETVTVYRVERLKDYEVFRREGRFVSFISTSESGYLKSYRDKKDLVLMKITIPPGIVRGNFRELLSEYEKAEESEILLPPYLSVNFREHEPDEEEKEIRDGQGKGPAVCCEVLVGKPILKDAYDLKPFDIQGCRRFYEALNRHRIPAEEDIRDYISWKEHIHEKADHLFR